MEDAGKSDGLKLNYVDGKKQNCVDYLRWTCEYNLFIGQEKVQTDQN